MAEQAQQDTFVVKVIMNTNINVLVAWSSSNMPIFCEIQGANYKTNSNIYIHEIHLVKHIENLKQNVLAFYIISNMALRQEPNKSFIKVWCIASIAHCELHFYKQKLLNVPVSTEQNQLEVVKLMFIAIFCTCFFIS